MVILKQLNIDTIKVPFYTRLKRESGEIPVRSRRCNGENVHETTGIAGKVCIFYEPESEYLPVLFTITLRCIGCVGAYDAVYHAPLDTLSGGINFFKVYCP